MDSASSSMGQSLFLIVVFIGVLALFPLAIRWLQKRGAIAPGGGPASAGMKVISTLAVGPQQRLVTVEVGPHDRRAWLVLGVAGNAITCLHTVPMGAGAAAPLPPVNAPTPEFARVLQEQPRA